MATKPIRFLELHFIMTQFLIIVNSLANQRVAFVIEYLSSRSGLKLNRNKELELIHYLFSNWNNCVIKKYPKSWKTRLKWK